MICTLFTGQTSKEGIFMRYSYEFKRKCVEMYRKGIIPEVPEGISKDEFKHQIRNWKRVEDANGSEALRHRSSNKCFIFYYGFIMGITNGFAVNISHEYGKKDYQSLKKHIAISIKLCIYTAIIFTCIGLILLKTTLILMKTDSNLISSCLRYGYFIWGGLIVTIFYNLLSSILRVIGDSRTPLIAVCISSVANIVLDLLTIFIFNLGVLGPAIATILSQFISIRKYKHLLYSKEVYTINIDGIDFFII